MWKDKKTWLTIGLGALIVIAVFCLIVCVACACNGLTFGQQVVQWFAGSTPTIKFVEEIVEGGIDTSALFGLIG